MTEELRAERAVHILDLFTKHFCVKNWMSVNIGTDTRKNTLE